MLDDSNNWSLNWCVAFAGLLIALIAFVWSYGLNRSNRVAPTEYDRVQNRWLVVLVSMWAVTIIVTIAATADILGKFARQDIVKLAERVAILESKLEGN